MGGAAAKERRRLKRLSEQEKLKGEGTTKVGSSGGFHGKHDGGKKGSAANGDTNEKKRQAFQLQNRKDKRIKPDKFQTKKSPSLQKGRKKEFDQKSKNKIPIKAKKVKKPKHLARKLKSETDPEVLRKLSKQQKDLDKHKSKRREKFREKVVELVGGEKFFNAKIFDKLMEKGGGKLESIVEAVKIDPNVPVISEEDNPTDSEEVPIEATTPKNPIENKTKESEKANNTEVDADENHAQIEDCDKEETSSSKETRKEKKGDTPSAQKDTTTHVMDNKQTSQTPTTKEEESNNEENNDNSNDSESSSDLNSTPDSDDDDVDLTMDSGRTRGRRRRGRQEADAIREEQQKQSKKEEGENEQRKQQQENEGDTSAPAKDTRRCIGRKPLTDYEIGKKFTGKVVYVKPKLGVFIDINCHVDAFCHISRCADSYVECITDDLYKVGDVLTDRVRIVNVDRRKKKITASLQSDEKIADEEKSNESWLKRQQDKKEKKMEKAKRASYSRDGGGSMQYSYNHDVDAAISHDENNQSDQPMGGDNAGKAFEEEDIVIDPDNMTPAELKRARKLQRRAERRKQQEITGIAA